MLSLPTGRPAERTPESAANRKPRVLHALVMGVAVPGIFCTVALPAYAASMEAGDTGSTAVLEAYKEDRAQSLAVDEDAPQQSNARDEYDAVSALEMRRAQLAAEMAAQRAAYRGPSVGSLLSSPPYPNFSLDTIVSVALQYQGAPYRYGGADPSGFDCSGFTQFVIANTVGIDIGHGVAGQTGYGAFVEWGAWAPGDLVFFANTFSEGISHVGIYIGDGQFIHAENESTGVTISSLYSDYYSSHYYGAYRIV